MRIRIVAKGWEGFTGKMGQGVEFIDGVSVDDVSQIERNRIAANVLVEDAESGDQIGPAAANLALRGIPAGDDVRMERATKAAEAAEARRVAQELMDKEELEKEAALLEAAKKASDAETPIYTRDELEAIARNDGIKPLRDLGDTYGVKGRSISEMIEAILKAQAKKALA